MATIKDPVALANQVISQFGNSYQQIVQNYYSSENSQFSQTYLKELNALEQTVELLKQSAKQDLPPVGGNAALWGSWLSWDTVKSFSYSLWEVKGSLEEKIQKVCFLFLNVKREVAAHPNLNPYQERWSPFQAHQETLFRHLFAYLAAPFESSLGTIKQDAGGILKESVVPYLFNTAALFTPKGPVFWGSLLLEWGFSHDEVAELPNQLLSLHPHIKLITSRRLSFLPDKEVLPPFKETCKTPWDFKSYVLYRTLDALEVTIGCPFPSEVRKELFLVFVSNEDARMDVSFELGYSKRLLKEDVVYSDKNSQKILKTFQRILNLFIAHVSPGTRSDDPHLQTLILWAFRSEGNLTGGIASHDYPYTLHELTQQKGYPVQALLPKREELAADPQPKENVSDDEVKSFLVIEDKPSNQLPEFQEIKCSPEDLVKEVRKLTPLYEDPVKKNGEAFIGNALSLLTTYLSVHSIPSWEFLIECFKHPLIKISTRQAIDFLTEQGHKKDFNEELELFRSISEKIPQEFQKPSFYFFSIFITRYDSEKCSFETRNERVETFFSFFKSQTYQGISSDTLFKGLHQYLMGNQVCEVALAFQEVYGKKLNLEELFSLKEIPHQIEEEKAGLKSLAQSIAKPLKKVVDRYSFKDIDVFCLFCSTLNRSSAPEILDSYDNMFQQIESYIGSFLPQSEVYTFLSFPLDPSMKQGFFPVIARIMKSLVGKRQRMCDEKGAIQVVVDPKYVQQINGELSDLADLEPFLEKGKVSFRVLLEALLFASFPTTVNFHLRCFPSGVQESGQLRFPANSFPHILLPINGQTENQWRALGEWKKRDDYFSYRFSLHNRQSSETYFEEIKLDLPVKLLRQEPEIFSLLKKLCELSYDDTKIAFQSIKLPLADLEQFLFVYPQAKKAWEAYQPREADKSTLEKPLYDFLTSLKVASRQLLMHFILHRKFPFRERGNHSVREWASQGHFFCVKGKVLQSAYAVVPPHIIDASFDAFRFFAVEEDMSPLVLKANNLLKNQSGFTPFQKEAAKQEVIPVSNDGRNVIYTCLPRSLKSEETCLPFYDAVDDFTGLTNTVVHIATHDMSYGQLPLQSFSLQLSKDEQTSFTVSEFLFTFSRDKENQMITLTLMSSPQPELDIPFPTIVEKHFHIKDLSDQENAKNHVGMLVAQFKGAFYKNLIRYSGLDKQQFHVALSDQPVLPLLSLECVARKVPSTEYEALSCKEIEGVNLTLSALYKGKVAETTFFLARSGFSKPAVLTSSLRYLMACLKMEFYKVHQPS